MCPKLIELLSWNGPTVHVCCFMLARASTKTFVSRIDIRQPSPKNSEKIFVTQKIRQQVHSLAEVSLYSIPVKCLSSIFRKLFFSTCHFHKQTYHLFTVTQIGTLFFKKPRNSSPSKFETGIPTEPLISLTGLYYCVLPGEIIRKPITHDQYFSMIRTFLPTWLSFLSFLYRFPTFHVFTSHL